MALDPSIILGIRPPDIKPYDASEGMIKGLTLKNLMQQSKANEFDSKLKEQSYSDDQTLRSVYSGANGDPNAVRQGLIEKGLYKQLNEYDKQALEIKKSQTGIDKDLSSIGKDKLETDIKKLDILNNVGMGPMQAYKNAIANDVSPEMAIQAIQPMWESAISGLKNTGMFDEQTLSGLPPQFNPQAVEARLSQGLKYSDVLNNEIQRRGQDITVRGQDVSRDTAIRGQNMSADTARRGQDITVRGQNLTDERGREANDISRTKAGNEKITDTQRVNSGYAARMEAADKIFNGTKSQKPGIIETIAGGAPLIGNEISANMARGLDGDRQSSLQAQEDWVRAKLRKESGAVIGEDEMAREIRTYFPKIGDGEKVIKQKEQARRQALAGMETSAGAAKTQVLNSTQEGATGQSKSGKPMVYKNGKWEYK